MSDEVMTDLKSQVDSTGLRLKELLEMDLEIGAGAIDVAAISPSDISVEDDLANFCRCSYESKLSMGTGIFTTSAYSQVFAKSRNPANEISHSSTSE
jgi:hypothetical protein